MSKITVAVRVRPSNERELASGAADVLLVSDGTISMTRLVDGESKSFNFDLAYAAKANNVSFGSQEKVYRDIGVPILDEALKGINQCLFAYGQTGSGKSYTMMGYDDPGVIPRLTEELFERVKVSSDPIKIWVSFLEIYNEKIRDLLHPTESEDGSTLSIFEHQKLGVVVPEATIASVQSYADVKQLMELGLRRRASASTSMNATSSRSHAIYTLHVETKTSISRINLVDLAGSERITKSHAEGGTQREAVMINQSLTNLGLVIKALSEKKDFVPFRNSKLTFLLKDSLAGNSRTYMIATVSPSASELEETISTLRFASNVKRIVTNPHVNFGSHEDLVNALKAEIVDLRSQLSVFQQSHPKEEAEDINASMKLKSAVLKMLKSGFDKTKKSSPLSTLTPIDTSAERTPYLVNVSDDPLLAGVLTCALLPGETVTVGSDVGRDKLVLRGEGITPSMASVENKEQVLWLSVDVGGVDVNGETAEGSCKLSHNDIITFGKSSVFRVVIPDLIDSVTSPKWRPRAASVAVSASPEVLLRDHLVACGIRTQRVEDAVAVLRRVRRRIAELENSADVAERMKFAVRLFLQPVCLDQDEVLGESFMAVEVSAAGSGKELLTVEQFETSSFLEEGGKSGLPNVGGCEQPSSELVRVLESISRRLDSAERTNMKLKQLSSQSEGIIAKLLADSSK